MIKKIGDRFFFKDTGEVVYPMYQNYTCVEDYKRDNVLSIEPMTAKEEDRKEELEKMLAPNSGYYAEEKFDGTRGLMHFYRGLFDPPQKYRDSLGIVGGGPVPFGHVRVFSRRISDVTGWYSENTDLLPHLRRLDHPQLAGTVIDGELFIPDRPFKDVSSTLNCKWEKALDRQIELGLVAFHAFDIIWYKGVYIARMPLWKRKQYLQKVVATIDSPYVKMVQYSDNDIVIPISKGFYSSLNGDRYPTLHSEICDVFSLTTSPTLQIALSKKAYYEYIVANGGEGIILKNMEGQYFHKRGREYTKLKKTLTREVIILGFSEPTKEYKGKAPSTWSYWEDTKTKKVYTIDWDSSEHMSMMNDPNGSFVPVSKYYAENWVGNLRFGVVVTPEEKEKLLKSKKGKQFKFETLIVDQSRGGVLEVLEVGECSGMDEETRAFFSCNYLDFDGNPIHVLPENIDEAERADLQMIRWEGEVIEVEANEVFKDTGKLRHPRYLRMRHDKAPEDCTWKDHISAD